MNLLNELAAAVPFAAVAAFAVGVWTIYKWRVERPKDKAQLVLLQKQVEESKALAFLSFDFETEVFESQGNLFLQVKCEVFNQGLLKAVCDLRHPDVLSVARVVNEGGKTKFCEPFYSSLPLIRDGEVTSWSWHLIPPSCNRVFNFLVPIPCPGIYFIELKLVPGEQQVAPFRQENSFFDDNLPLYWSGSEFVEV